MIRLLDVYNEDGSPKPLAVSFLFDVIAERMTEPAVNISATMPSLTSHREFVAKRPYRCWYLIEEYDETSDRLVGYVSATKRNEIGIVLLKRHRSKGYGAEAIGLLRQKHSPLPEVPSERRGRWIANVNPDNEHSKHLFGEKLGGKLIQITYEL